MSLFGRDYTKADATLNLNSDEVKAHQRELTAGYFRTWAANRKVPWLKEAVGRKENNTPEGMIQYIEEQIQIRENQIKETIRNVTEDKLTPEKLSSLLRQNKIREIEITLYNKIIKEIAALCEREKYEFRSRK